MLPGPEAAKNSQRDPNKGDLTKGLRVSAHNFIECPVHYSLCLGGAVAGPEFGQIVRSNCALQVSEELSLVQETKGTLSCVKGLPQLRVSLMKLAELFPLYETVS